MMKVMLDIFFLSKKYLFYYCKTLKIFTSAASEDMETNWCLLPNPKLK